MLTYGRNAKMTFYVFMSQERHKPFLCMLIFIMGVSPSNFVVVSFLLTSLRKGYFLRQRIRRYRFLKAGTAVLLVLNILLRDKVKCELQVASCKLRVASRELRVASWVMKVQILVLKGGPNTS